MRAYEIIDHTADIGVVVRGASLEELFANAAYAFFDLQVGLERVGTAESREVVVEGDDLEQLMVRWLQQLLVLLEVEELVVSEFNIEQADESGVRACVRGETLDPRRHELKGEIKAVTYHELEVEETTQGWQAQIIFDV